MTLDEEGMVGGIDMTEELYHLSSGWGGPDMAILTSDGALEGIDFSFGNDMTVVGLESIGHAPNDSMSASGSQVPGALRWDVE